jgi:hypothetical protein
MSNVLDPRVMITHHYMVDHIGPSLSLVQQVVGTCCSGTGFNISKLTALRRGPGGMVDLWDLDVYMNGAGNNNNNWQL